MCIRHGIHTIWKYGDRDGIIILGFGKQTGGHSGENKKLTCLGDEPYHENSLRYVQDSDIKNRKQAYTAEGRRYYSGNLFVPDDLEEIELPI